jgi:hypothetical protein
LVELEDVFVRRVVTDVDCRIGARFSAKVD